MDGSLNRPDGALAEGVDDTVNFLEQLVAEWYETSGYIVRPKPANEPAD